MVKTLQSHKKMQCGWLVGWSDSGMVWSYCAFDVYWRLTLITAYDVLRCRFMFQRRSHPTLYKTRLENRLDLWKCMRYGNVLDQLNIYKSKKYYVERCFPSLFYVCCFAWLTFFAKRAMPVACWYAAAEGQCPSRQITNSKRCLMETEKVKVGTSATCKSWTIVDLKFVSKTCDVMRFKNNALRTYISHMTRIKQTSLQKACVQKVDGFRYGSIPPLTAQSRPKSASKFRHTASHSDRSWTSFAFHLGPSRTPYYFNSELLI